MTEDWLDELIDRRPVLALVYLIGAALVCRAVQLVAGERGPR